MSRTIISLSEKYPNIAEMWHQSNKVKPTEISFGSHSIFWWKCPASPDHEWQASVNSITNNKRKYPNPYSNSCPFCHGLKICESSSFEATHPHLLAEWNYGLNKLKPSEIRAGSHKKVWWICKKNHVWQSEIKTRTYTGQNCPYCNNKRVCTENCLLTLYPELCKQWDYDKNIKTPDAFIAHTKNKAWWICEKGHSYYATISDRTQKGSGCPICKQSKGEKKITKFLEMNNLEFKPEYKFDLCRNKLSLPFDFAIFKNNQLFGIIEYQGIHHYKPVGFGGDPQKNFEKIQFNDSIKKQFLIENKIDFMEISYTDFKNVDSLLSVFLKDLIHG